MSFFGMSGQTELNRMYSYRLYEPINCYLICMCDTYDEASHGNFYYFVLDKIFVPEMIVINDIIAILRPCFATELCKSHVNMSTQWLLSRSITMIIF